MSLNYDDSYIKNNMFKASFGIEKESLRVNTGGYLSHTSHPFENNPNIDRDFCENQVEIVTDVYDSSDAVYDALKKLHNTVIRRLSTLQSGEEILWMFSNPPYVKGESDIPIASFKGRLHGKEIYRK